MPRATRTLKLNNINDLEKNLARGSDIREDNPPIILDITSSFIADCHLDISRLTALLTLPKASLLLCDIEAVRLSQTDLKRDNLQVFIEILSCFQTKNEINRLILENNILTAESIVPLLNAIQTQFQSIKSIYASEQHILFRHQNGQINTDLLSDFLSALQSNTTLHHLDISRPKMPALHSREKYEQDLLLEIKKDLNGPININNIVLFTNEERSADFQQFISARRLHDIQESTETDASMSGIGSEASDYSLPEQFSALSILSGFEQQPPQDRAVAEHSDTHGKTVGLKK
tara:strand:+ start:71967 stop:72836 length:870 start_codon:yes stop_codon:yes gene_type:complete